MRDDEEEEDVEEERRCLRDFLTAFLLCLESTFLTFALLAFVCRALIAASPAATTPGPLGTVFTVDGFCTAPELTALRSDFRETLLSASVAFANAGSASERAAEIANPAN